MNRTTRMSKCRTSSAGWLLAGAVLLPVASCRQVAGDEPWVRQDVIADVAWSRADLSRGDVIWRGEGWELSALGPDAIKRLQDRRTGARQLVMVSLAQGSRLARELPHDPLTLAFVPPTQDTFGAALVEVPDAATHAALATAAHRDAGHVCGAIELLDLLTMADTAPITLPVYAEPVKLPSVAALTAAVDQDEIVKTIKALEAMGTRRMYSDSGKAAPAAIKTMFETAANGGLTGMTVTLVEHQNTDQDSVVVHLPAVGAAADGPMVVIGAHLDSINQNEVAGPAPGADDDGSGIATLVEVVRVLGAAKATFSRPVEIQAYAGEEDGLIGSNEIARDYATKGKKVAAQFQIDMNAWAHTAGDDKIYLVTNDTQSTLRRSAADLAFAYLDGNIVEGTLKGGTSDHRSWTRAGFASVFPFENPIDYNEALHSPADNFETINTLGLAKRVTQLALSFAAHHGGLTQANAAYSGALTAFRQATSSDLKIAIEAAGDNKFQIHIAAPESVSSIQLCTTKEGSPFGCTEERRASVVDREEKGRKFHGAVALMDLTEGAHLAIFGLDTDGKMVAHRAVKLAKK